MTALKTILERHGVNPKQSLGQNFLTDTNMARHIVDLAEVAPGEAILEIGPGAGALTGVLAATGARVVALEIDQRLLPVLADFLEDRSNVELVHGDALRVDYAELLGATDPSSDQKSWVMVSNLPYNIAVLVVMKLAEEVPQVIRMQVMVQREVGERLCANPGDELFGAVSVKLSYFAAASLLGRVPPEVFFPRPKVGSALVRIVRHLAAPVDVPSREDLFGLIDAGFSTRRKMLRSALKERLGVGVISILESAEIDPTSRAEVISLQDWARLARVVAMHQTQQSRSR